MPRKTISNQVNPSGVSIAVPDVPINPIVPIAPIVPIVPAVQSSSANQFHQSIGMIQHATEVCEYNLGQFLAPRMYAYEDWVDG